MEEASRCLKDGMRPVGGYAAEHAATKVLTVAVTLEAVPVGRTFKVPYNQSECPKIF